MDRVCIIKIAIYSEIYYPKYTRCTSTYKKIMNMSPAVQEAWRAAGVAWLVASSDEAFWNSLIDGSFRRETDWRRVFVT